MDNFVNQEGASLISLTCSSKTITNIVIHTHGSSNEDSFYLRGIGTFTNSGPDSYFEKSFTKSSIRKFVGDNLLLQIDACRSFCEDKIDNFSVRSENLLKFFGAKRGQVSLATTLHYSTERLIQKDLLDQGIDVVAKRQILVDRYANGSLALVLSQVSVNFLWDGIHSALLAINATDNFELASDTAVAAPLLFLKLAVALDLYKKMNFIINWGITQWNSLVPRAAQVITNKKNLFHVFLRQADGEFAVIENADQSLDIHSFYLGFNRRASLRCLQALTPF
jgi:hypothetical protein